MFTRFSCKSCFDITLNDPTMLPSSPFSDRIPRVTVERDKDPALEELSVGVSRPVARPNLRVLLANDDPRAGSRLDIRFWPIVLTVYKVQIFYRVDVKHSFFMLLDYTFTLTLRSIERALTIGLILILRVYFQKLVIYIFLMCCISWRSGAKSVWTRVQTRSRVRWPHWVSPRASRPPPPAKLPQPPPPPPPRVPLATTTCWWASRSTRRRCRRPGAARAARRARAVCTSTACREWLCSRRASRRSSTARSSGCSPRSTRRADETHFALAHLPLCATGAAREQSMLKAVHFQLVHCTRTVLINFEIDTFGSWHPVPIKCSKYQNGKS